MMPKAVIVIALVAFVSGASALKWKPCDDNSAEILNVTVADCDNSKDVCEMRAHYYRVDVDFVQSELMTENQSIKVQYAENDAASQGGSCGHPLICPGQVGQVQHLSHMVRSAVYHAEKPERTMRLSLQQQGAAKPHVCVEIPIKVLA